VELTSVNGIGQGVVHGRLDLLADLLRSTVRMARLLLDEVLDVRFSGEAPDEYQNLVGKAGGELAMLLRLARRALPDAADQESIARLARDVAPLARSAFVRRELLFRPSRAPMYALAHFCLAELGVPDERLDRLARRALGSCVNAANERVPYRMLDAAWTRHLVFGDAELNHPAIALSPLGAGVDLLNATVNDAYAFTHALPYATDFGRVPLPLGLDRQNLLGIAEALAVQALDEDDLDLLSEVLMAPAILRIGWTPTLTFSWHVLERVWTEFGFVPGPGLRPAPCDENRIQRVRRVLGGVYHTTFAAGLCCGTLITCNAFPPELPAGPPGGMGLPDGKASAWKVNWTTSSARAQQEMRFLELAFSLRRAVESADFEAVRHVLYSSADAGLLEHPLFTQALELLERVGAGE
jgi:hypothetical protein